MTALLGAFLALFSPVAAAPDAAHDTRALTAAERRGFFPLVCRKHVVHGKADSCIGVLGYPGLDSDGPQDLSLNAISYGSFSRAGADEAYVSYSSSFEAHVTNFGGGILFRRASGKWRLVQWYSGQQMHPCVALPGPGAQKMLCLSGYFGSGEADSSVFVVGLPHRDHEGNWDGIAKRVLSAQDDRQAGAEESLGNYQCDFKRRPGEALLLSIDDLQRASAPGVLAQSHITYAVGRDTDTACRGKGFAHVRETKGVVRYVLRGGTVMVQAPAAFAPQDL